MSRQGSPAAGLRAGAKRQEFRADPGTRLIQIGQEPCCAEAQADGVPCASVHRQCDACAAVFERVQALVELSFPRPAERSQKI